VTGCTHSIGTNVGGTLEEANRLESGLHSALDHVAAAVANHGRGGLELDALGVRASAGGIDDREKVALLVVGSTVAGDDAPGAGEGTSAVAGDLGKSGAGLGHGGGQVSNLELAVGGGLAETILHGVLGVAAEDGGVLLSGGVGAEASDGGTLDTKGSAVSTLVTT
jgi:hypothetical protein